MRDKQGHELDALIELTPDELPGIEIKSGATVASDFFAGLDYWRGQLKTATLQPWLIHGGEARQ